MNKKEREELRKKIESVEETVRLLKHQESNLLEAIIYHPDDMKNVKVWVRELFIGSEYIVRLENTIDIMKGSLPKGGKRGGKKKD